MTKSDPASLGQPIPAETGHAVSVSLPTWRANVGYEEGEEWVTRRMTTGYPRFFIHRSIEAFAAAIVQRHGSPTEQAYLFPSPAAAARCADFIRRYTTTDLRGLRSVDLYPNDADRPTVSALLMAREHSKVAKAFWQHTGEGISSRRADYCMRAFKDGSLSARISMTLAVTDIPEQNKLNKGPKRYQKGGPLESLSLNVADSPGQSNGHDGKDCAHFVEERFGRNLDLSLARNAKKAICKRIAGALAATEDLPDSLQSCQPQTRARELPSFSEQDVYVYPCGMNSIFHAHQLMMACRGQMKSISYGFPYIDTLKILEKFGPGCLFYGHDSEREMNDLERRCEAGEKFLALFCEFPGNPLLKTPDLRRLRSLADRYDFALIVDETIGNFINVNVLSVADVVVSSLTKVFTGECNVMGGSLVLNPQGRYYADLKPVLEKTFEDNYWPEDVIFMERNSRDFVSRIKRINSNAEVICEALLSSPLVKEVFYPKHSASRSYYDRFRNPCGGYGGLLSVTFQTPSQAITFFDHIETAKGPSLGTNFTLSSPYVLLAHYGELEWAKQYGVEADLVRMSVGLENPVFLRSVVARALQAVEQQVGLPNSDMASSR